MGRDPPDMGGTSVADLPGQQSVGCPVLETELRESEAELSETSVPWEDAVGNSQLSSQHLVFINANTLSEIKLAGSKYRNGIPVKPRSD